MYRFLRGINAAGIVVGFTFLTTGRISWTLALVCISVNSLAVLANYAISSLPEEKYEIDNSPQARFARDEISQLEMEQEIDRQLSIGKSGREQMNLARGFKEIPVDEYEAKTGVGFIPRRAPADASPFKANRFCSDCQGTGLITTMNYSAPCDKCYAGWKKYPGIHDNRYRQSAQRKDAFTNETLAR